jgi:glycosyltransferase involved in cell wall biosynthesis
MKVLFVIKPNSTGTDGGSHTFLLTVIDGFKNLKPSHEFYYIESNSANNPIKNIVKNGKFDLVWFLTPYYEETDSPFAITVWDLAHRFHPYFPELSITGWTFDQRDQFYRHVLPKATFVITGNSVGADHLNDFYRISRKQIKVIPLPVNKSECVIKNETLLNRYNLKPEKYLFYPAQFWPHKNHITVINAFCLAKKTLNDFKLVFTGSDKGNLNHVKQHAANLNLQDSVLFLGFVDKEIISQLYINAFAHIYASCIGPDNLPPLEAMVFNCPTICSRFEGAMEQLRDAVLYFDPLDPDDCAKSILELENPKLRIALQHNGQALISQLSGENYCKQVLQIINEFEPLRKLWPSGNEYRHT